ncbi:Fc.00g044610.m01.CDS01 [Cosmosporella sp. VM-42]
MASIITFCPSTFTTSLNLPLQAQANVFRIHFSIGAKRRYSENIVADYGDLATQDLLEILLRFNNCLFAFSLQS